MGKEEAVLAFDQAAADAKGALYDAGFVDGVASVPANPGEGVDMGLSAADEALALEAAVAPLHAQIDSLGLQVNQVKALKDSLAALLASLG